MKTNKTIALLGALTIALTMQSAQPVNFWELLDGKGYEKIKELVLANPKTSLALGVTASAIMGVDISIPVLINVGLFSKYPKTMLCLYTVISCGALLSKSIEKEQMAREWDQRNANELITARLKLEQKEEEEVYKQFQDQPNWLLRFQVMKFENLEKIQQLIDQGVNPYAPEFTSNPSTGEEIVLPSLYEKMATIEDPTQKQREIVAILKTSKYKNPNQG